VAVEVAVAAADRDAPLRTIQRLLAGTLCACLTLPSLAAILPEDRADVMYHDYDGGGLQVDGPSILVRKGFKEKVSVWSNYYVDMISSASVDVVATASPYKEKRTEISGGVDYLHGKTLMGMSYTNSNEDDYIGNTARVSVSQDFFGDLTTLSISYARGWDKVMRNGDDDFQEHTDRQTYGVDLSQVVTPNMVVNLSYASITEDGYLHNPYRSARYLDASAPKGYAYEAEVSPGTRTSSATALRGMYYLPYRASVQAEYRYYTDTWNVDAWYVGLGYVQPLQNGFTVEFRYRYYSQNAADFYSDLYSGPDSQNFLSRDKELSTFTSHSIGVGVNYDFSPKMLPLFKRGQVSLFADFLYFNYDDFRDVLKGGAPGEEPLYSFESTVLRAYVSFWY